MKYLWVLQSLSRVSMKKVTKCYQTLFYDHLKGMGVVANPPSVLRTRIEKGEVP